MTPSNLPDNKRNPKDSERLTSGRDGKSVENHDPQAEADLKQKLIKELDRFEASTIRSLYELVTLMEP